MWNENKAIAVCGIAICGAIAICAMAQNLGKWGGADKDEPVRPIVRAMVDGKFEKKTKDDGSLEVTVDLGAEKRTFVFQPAEK